LVVHDDPTELLKRLKDYKPSKSEKWSH